MTAIKPEVAAGAVWSAQLYDAMIGIAEKRLDKAGLAQIFRRNLPS